MDYNKIGKFIISERKAKNLTQAKLAEKLFVSEKTVSKWENGNGIPDTNTLPKLCEIFDVSLNELLSGERLSTENYVTKAEDKLLESQKLKEESDKRLLLSEIIIGILATLLVLTFIFVAIYVIYTLKKYFLGILLFVVGFIIFIVSCAFCLYIEQKAGFYRCEKCNNKYVPTFNQILWAPHMGRTRYMKCPRCNKKSWNKKIIK